MPAPLPSAECRPGLSRRLTLVLAVVLLAAGAYYAFGRGGLSLDVLARHRDAIDAFVSTHRVLALLSFIGIYVVAVALSVPGALFLTVSGGFLFGMVAGTVAAVLGATVGATLIFLLARTALGEPLLKRAGPRAVSLAEGFRQDAFSYLLFLRLVPAFPFFRAHLVPAFAGVKLMPFVVATLIGVTPGSFVFALAGTGLDSVIAAQKSVYDACIASGRADCHLTFEPADILTPQLIGALIALGILALVPVVVRRWRQTAST